MWGVQNTNKKLEKITEQHDTKLIIDTKELGQPNLKLKKKKEKDALGSQT